MRTKTNIRIIAMVLIMTFAVSFMTIGVSAQDNANWSQKISDELLEVMSTADSKDKISVWVWFTDIEQEEVEEQVKAETGLSEEDLNVASKAADDKLAYELSSKLDAEEKQDVSDEINAYLNVTQNERAEEKERTDKYIKARRNIARDMYVEKNKKNVNELKLPKDEIIFQSELTSSVIVNLTKSQINRAAKSKEVVSIDLHTEVEYEPPMCENQTKTTNTDKAQEEFGLTGEGVNVLMNDHGCVRSDGPNYDCVSNHDNLYVVDNKTIYTSSNTSDMPGSKRDGHPNLIAGTMQAFAPDVNIYSVGYGCLEDLEWAIRNCDIDLINGSVNYGSNPYAYSDDGYAKWFDALVSTYRLTLVASAGNSESWTENGWPNVITPSSGYNCISAGAYSSPTGISDDDTLHNFRYNYPNKDEIKSDSEIKCDTRVNYKPDMVIAAGSTSEASPSFSGVIALMIQLKPSLKAEPELIKAILMASCHRKVAVNYDNIYGISRDESMSDGLTLRQGAGAIDAYRAISIILKGNYGTDTISTGSIEKINDITIAKSDNSNVNVSIAWLRANEYEGYSVHNNDTVEVGTLQELELEVNGPKSVESAKTNTGKQLVYLDNACPSGDYTINVTKASENTEPVKFAYAWSTEDISVKHIKFSSTDGDNTLSRGEVENQLSSTGIGSEMFTVSFDSSVMTIGDGALKDITNMETVNIHNGITTISTHAFEGCSALTNVTIPESVEKIGVDAFKGCTNLCEVYLQSIEAPEISEGAFSGITEGAIGYLEGYAEWFEKEGVGYVKSYDDLTIDYEVDERIIYFDNKYDWKEVNAFLWKYSVNRNNEWPGIPMEYDEVKNAYYIEVYYNKYDKIIINDGSTGTQTLNLDAGLDEIYYVLEPMDDKYFLFDSKRYYK